MTIVLFCLTNKTFHCAIINDKEKHEMTLQKLQPGHFWHVCLKNYKNNYSIIKNV